MLGWTRTQMQSWPTSDYTLTNIVTTYDMRWSDANVAEALWKPDFRTFYLGTAPWISTGVDNTYWRRWGPSGLLCHPTRCHRDGVYGSTGKGQHLVAYQFYNVNTATMDTAQSMEPDGDLGAIAGGTQFWPGGIV